jgi:cell division transport system permease protein
MLANHSRALAQALSRARSLSNFLLVLGIALSLCLPAILVQAVNGVGHSVGGGVQEPRITLYLSMGVTDSVVNELEAALKKRTDILSAQFVSASDAWADMKKNPALTSATSLLATNPLPNVYVVRVRDTSPAVMAGVREQLAALPGVEEARLDSQWALRFQGLMALLRKGVLFFGALLGLSVGMVVANTVRLQILSARDELEVAHFLGASRSWMARPFLWFGFLQGLFGALLAAALMALVAFMVNPSLADLGGLLGITWRMPYPGPSELFTLVMAAGLLGWISAWLAVLYTLPRSR